MKYTDERPKTKDDKRYAHGFTLVEMITVVCIIALLIALLMAAVVRARAFAERSSIQAYLGHLSAGIDAYYADFSMYPVSTPSGTLTSGSACLAEALMGYQPGNVDGAGPVPPFPDSSSVYKNDATYGFRLTTGGNGRIYGPYMKVDVTSYSVTVSSETTSGTPSTATDQYFTDPLGQRILYFRANKITASTLNYFGTATTGIFTTTDNLTSTYGDPTAAANSSFLLLLGNTGGGNTALAGNDKINPNETPINQQTYLLVSPGINGSANATNWYNGDGTTNGLYNSVVNSN